MSGKIKITEDGYKETEINDCIRLYIKIEEEYPQELNLDELHEVTGKYATIKEYRDRINEYPKEVRTLCEFILTTKCSDEERIKFFSHITNNPRSFSKAKDEKSLEKQRRFADMAGELNIPSSTLFHLFGAAKLKGVLGKEDELVEEYRWLIERYLE